MLSLKLIRGNKKKEILILKIDNFDRSVIKQTIYIYLYIYLAISHIVDLFIYVNDMFMLFHLMTRNETSQILSEILIFVLKSPHKDICKTTARNNTTESIDIYHGLLYIHYGIHDEYPLCNSIDSNIIKVLSSILEVEVAITL